MKQDRSLGLDHIRRLSLFKHEINMLAYVDLRKRKHKTHDSIYIEQI